MSERVKELNSHIGGSINWCNRSEEWAGHTTVNSAPKYIPKRKEHTKERDTKAFTRE